MDQGDILTQNEFVTKCIDKADTILFDYDDTIVEYVINKQTRIVVNALIKTIGIDDEELSSSLLVDGKLESSIIHKVCYLSKIYTGSSWTIFSTARRFAFTTHNEKLRSEIIRSIGISNVGIFWNNFRYFSTNIRLEQIAKKPEGLQNLLMDLESKGKEIGIVSNSNSSLVYMGLKYLNILEYFNEDIIFCLKDESNENKYGLKPNCTILSDIFDSQNVFYFGNTVQDALFTERAGVPYALYDPKALLRGNRLITVENYNLLLNN